MNKSVKSLINIRAIKYGSFAGVFYFFVALLANWNAPFSVKLLSSTAHGFICFIMTFLSTTFMEFFFHKFSKTYQKYLGSVFFSGLISLFIICSVHFIIKTPNIFATIVASALMSLPYYLLFPLKLVFEQDKRSDKFSYRLNENWKNETWPLKWFSPPYYLEDLLIVFKHNFFGPSIINEESIFYTKRKFDLSKKETKTKLVFLGDLMPTYEFDWSLDVNLIKKIKNCDYLICNLEGLIESDQKVFLGQYHNGKILDSLKELLPPERIILSMANNHCADAGMDIFDKNMNLLKNHGLQVIGRRDHPSILLNNSINLVAATQWSNQPHGYLSFLDFANNYLISDKINILFPHWGYELELFPNSKWENLSNKLLKDWDHIIGHHSHIPGPVTLKNQDHKNKLVAYSLGDASTGLPRPLYRHGIVLFLEFDDKDLLRGEWSFTNIKKKSNQLILTEVHECELLKGVEYEK